MSLGKTFTEAHVIWWSKSWNTFYITMIGCRDGPSNVKDTDDEIQHLQFMVGSKMYPEYPIKSHAEFFDNLRTSLEVFKLILYTQSILKVMSIVMLNLLLGLIQNVC